MGHRRTSGTGGSQEEHNQTLCCVLINENESNVKEGHLTLQPGVCLKLVDDRPANIPTSLWGPIWMVYMMLQLGRCHQGGNCLKLLRTYSRGRQTNIHSLANHGNGGSAKQTSLLAHEGARHNRQRKKQHLFPSNAWKHSWQLDQYTAHSCTMGDDAQNLG